MNGVKNNITPLHSLGGEIIFFYLFVCLFFHLNNLRIPPGKKIGQYLCDILSIQKLYICFFVCFVYLFIFQSSWDTPRNKFWKFHNDRTWFSWDIVNLKKCLFVCLLVCFCLFSFKSSLDTPKKIFWTFCKDQIWFSWDIVNLNICLFVCWFVCLFIFSFFNWIISGYPQEDFLKLFKDRTCFGWDIHDWRNF